MSEEISQKANRRIMIDLDIIAEYEFVAAVNEKYGSNAGSPAEAIDVCVENAFVGLAGSNVPGWSKPLMSQWKTQDDLIRDLWEVIDETKDDCCHKYANPCPPTHNCPTCNTVDLG
jgi:hypothetical protein